MSHLHIRFPILAPLSIIYFLAIFSRDISLNVVLISKGLWFSCNYVQRILIFLNTIDACCGTRIY